MVGIRYGRRQREQLKKRIADIVKCHWRMKWEDVAEEILEEIEK